MMPGNRFKFLYLPLRVRHAGYGPKNAFREAQRGRVFDQGQDALLDVWREAKEHEHLGHTSPADAFAPGDVGLPGDCAGFEFPLPLQGLAEGFSHERYTGRLGRHGASDAGGNAVDDGFEWKLAREAANVPVLESPIRPKGDLDGLLAILGGLHGERHKGRTGLLRAVDGHVGDAEPDLGFGDPGLIEGSLLDVFPPIRYELIAVNKGN